MICTVCIKLKHHYVLLRRLVHNVGNDAELDRAVSSAGVSMTFQTQCETAGNDEIRKVIQSTDKKHPDISYTRNVGDPEDRFIAQGMLFYSSGD